MRRWLWLFLLAAGLYLGAEKRGFPVVEVFPLPKIQGEEPFRDVSFGQRWYDGAQYGYRRGLVRGIGEGEFGGELTATRAMAATMVWRMAGEPEVLGKSGFADVEPGRWYTAAAVWGESRGLWEGFGDGTFRPHDAVTREQLELVLKRYFGEERTVRAAALRMYGRSPGGETGEMSRGELAEILMEVCEKGEKEGAF